ncbi:hypothetical protein BD289DRAFT_118553 [Coniella lustricola]|uniref:Uncharacterized protein n=1 Tax=Coniella lustricola TaxID=2025994 RepID=A0A2T3AG71_9PEZI|nr:hypothetical protein BD289DRAFT_118553 [Coniella lustricola]
MGAGESHEKRQSARVTDRSCGAAQCPSWLSMCRSTWRGVAWERAEKAKGFSLASSHGDTERLVFDRHLPPSSSSSSPSSPLELALSLCSPTCTASSREINTNAVRPLRAPVQGRRRHLGDLDHASSWSARAVPESHCPFFFFQCPAGDVGH